MPSTETLTQFATAIASGEIKVERTPTSLDANGCPWQNLSLTTKLQLSANAEAKGAIRQISFLGRATAQNPDAVAAADADPNNVEAAFAAADVQLLSQDVAGAFERLISLVKRTAGDERAAVRARLVELFDLFDAADPDVIAGRRNLANALF